MWNRLIKAWKARRLQTAREQHAYWKAKAEEIRRVPLSVSEQTFGMDRYGRTHAAAMEAKYMERVEYFLRDQ